MENRLAGLRDFFGRGLRREERVMQSDMLRPVGWCCEFSEARKMARFQSSRRDLLRGATYSQR